LVDRNIQINMGYTALHKAVNSIHQDDNYIYNTRALELLLADPYIDFNIQEDERGYAALHMAVRRPIWTVERLLACNCINRNIQDKNGLTALHLAVQEDKVEFLKLLLSDPYVDCNIKDNEGRTAYDYAIYHETNEKIKKLLSKRTSFFNKHKKNIENTVYAICGIGIVLLLWQSKIWSNLNSTFF